MINTNTAQLLGKSLFKDNDLLSSVLKSPEKAINGKLSPDVKKLVDSVLSQKMDMMDIGGDLKNAPIGNYGDLLNRSRLLSDLFGSDNSLDSLVEAVNGLKDKSAETVNSFSYSESYEKTISAIKKNSSEGGLEVEFSMNLFHSLSQRISSERGEDEAGHFHRTTLGVVDRFQSDFSLKIKVTNEFLGDTEKVLDFDPELLGDFLNSMDALVSRDEKSVSEFIVASDKFFGDLAEKAGSAGDIFKEIGKSLGDQVKSFFGDVAKYAGKTLDLIGSLRITE